MNGHLTSEDLVLIAYGELENSEHLENCAECRAELESLKSFVGALPGLPTGDPGPEYEQHVWKSIEHRLPHAQVIPFRRQWVWKAMAAAAALILAFLAGHWTRPEPAAPRVALSEQARQRILQVAVLDHLERSRITLTEWMNLDPADTPEPESERLRAEDLLRENRLYRQSAMATGGAALNAVLEELERTLLDIARSPAKPAPDDVKRIQERIDEQGTLFKVRVAGESLRSEKDSVVRF
jgi:hypothetical protein